MDDVASLTYETVPAVGSTQAVVIWMHGLGADGHDFVPFVRQLPVRHTHGVRFILPHAPRRRVSLNGGAVMRAWFDVHALTLDGLQDQLGLRQSQQAIEALLQTQIDEGIQTDRMVLAGFSQGGAMALYTGLRYRYPLAGIMSLSGCLPGYATLPQERSAMNHHTPIWLGHGLDDAVLPMHFARHAQTHLQSLDNPLTSHTYPMGHQVCEEEAADCNAWLGGVLAAR